MFPSAVAKDSTVRWSRHHESSLPDTDSAEAAGSNIPPNIMLGSGSVGFVEGLVRATGPGPADNFFHDLGGAAEDRLGVLRR